MKSPAGGAKASASIEDRVAALEQAVAKLHLWASKMSTVDQKWTPRVQDWMDDWNREGKPKDQEKSLRGTGTKPPPPPPTYP